MGHWGPLVRVFVSWTVDVPHVWALSVSTVVQLHDPHCCEVWHCLVFIVEFWLFPAYIIIVQCFVRCCCTCCTTTTCFHWLVTTRIWFCLYCEWVAMSRSEIRWAYICRLHTVMSEEVFHPLHHVLRPFVSTIYCKYPEIH